jgi:hypothetical protein
MLENVEALVVVGRDCGSYPERFEPTRFWRWHLASPAGSGFA